MYKKRGQAALEFLMTYGWAILSAIIVIGALGSYFYFNSASTTTFVVGAPFYGVAASADATADVLSLEIENKGGESLDISSIAVTGADSGGCTANTTATTVTTGANVFTLSGCTLTSGANLKGDVVITYQRPGSSLDLRSTGSVTTAAI